MPSHQFNSGTFNWELLLDDLSVVSSPIGNHYLQPMNAPNGFVIFSAQGSNTAEVVARKIATATEYIQSDAGGWQAFAHDGSRYVIGASRISQGKQFYPRDLIAYIFDTQSPAWLDFVALGRPQLDIFVAIGGMIPGGQRANCLWVHNGNQVGGFNNTNPPGVIRRVSFVSATLIDYVIEQKANGDESPTTGFLKLQRTFTLSTGAMGAISQVASASFDPNNLPSWLYTP